MCGVGDRITLVFKGARRAMQISLCPCIVKQNESLLAFFFGQWGAIKGFKLRNDSVSVRLIQQMQGKLGWRQGEV